jgi:mono/diheme cytochrome c family protein
MRKRISIIVLMAVAFSSIPVRADGLFGFFRRRQRVQTFQVAQCVQPTYQVAYQPAVQYQAVAALPLTTIPVALDAQAYIYAVNSGYFANWSGYLNQLAQSRSQSSSGYSAPPEPAQASAPSSEDPRLAGAIVLKQNCITCHQKGNKPKSNFSIFDEKGDMYTNLPWSDIMERINASEPSQRMPPGKTLATKDIMSVFRCASAGAIPELGVKVASEPSKMNSPWD